MDRGRARLQDAVTLVYRKIVDSPERSQAAPWKFWRKLSTRRTEKKSRGTGKPSLTHTGGRLVDWTYRVGGDAGAGEGVLVTSGSLPDVVDKAVLRRSNSVKAPPKPPRLFLFRSSSINNPRSSLDGGSQRNSLQGAGVGVDVLVDTEPIYVNSAFGAGLQTGLCANNRVIPPAVHQHNNNNNNNNNNKHVISVMQSDTNMERDALQAGVYRSHTLARNGTLPHSHTPSSATAVSTAITHYNTLPAGTSPRHKQHNHQARLKSADRDGTKRSGRSRHKSSDRGEVSGHAHIMHSLTELLCQRLHPAPLLDPLLAAGVLSELDVQAFRGHPDRKLICESLAAMVGDGRYSQFSAFVDVVAASGQHQDIARVLAAMRDVDRAVHRVTGLRESTRREADHEAVLADERLVSYDVGYLCADGVTLRPIVELERADRRPPRQPSRLSAITIDSGDLAEGEVSDSVTSEPGVPGPLMVSVCITGHVLSGERARALAEVIGRHDCVLELRLGKTGLCGQDVAELCSALNTNTTLASLDVRLNAIDLTGARSVSNVLLTTRTLRLLNLSSSGLDVAGCGAVLAALTSNRTLTDLDLSFLDVGDAVCEAVRDMLRANACLQKLRLRSNNFSAAGCVTLAEGLARNRSVSELDLSRNCVCDAGLEALARYVPDSNVTDLGLENCGLTSAGCDAMAQMISGSRRLRSVDVSVNLLGDSGVFRLAAALERSSVLQTVGLNMCGVSNDGFCRLLDVLERNASIVLLKLCYNRLGNKDFTNPLATSDNLRYRLRIVTSSKPKLKILLWGNAFDDV